MNTGGRSFGPTILIDSVPDTGPTGLQEGGVVTAAVDLANGELYAAWSDSRYVLYARDDVLVSHSTDDGQPGPSPQSARPKGHTSALLNLDRYLARNLASASLRMASPSSSLRRSLT